MGSRVASATLRPVLNFADATLGRIPAGPVIARAVDVLLRGPLVDAIAREIADHAVIERALTQILVAATPNGDRPSGQDREVAGFELERAVSAAVDSGGIQLAVGKALESAGARDLVRTVFASSLLDDIVGHLLASEALWLLVQEIAESPAVTKAISQQGLGFVEQVGDETRRRSRRSGLLARGCGSSAYPPRSR